MANVVEGTTGTQLGPAFDYSFAKRDQPRADDFNRRWADISRRLSIQEAFVPNYEAALQVFITDALTRIDEFLRPAYDKLAAIAQLGALFTITSTSAVAVQLGTRQFSVDPALKDQFAAASYVVGFSQSNPGYGLSGKVVSYNRDAGVLTLLVDVINGPAGTLVNDWIFSAAADFIQYKAYVQSLVDGLRSDLVGGADSFMNSFREVEDRFTQIVGTATTAGDTLGELEGRIVALIGSADQYGDTLGELQALIKKANKKAVVMATALG